ncbi:MAG: alpha/beta hydrolase [Aeromonas sp.]
MIDRHPAGARHAIIWLHGLGDSGSGLAPLVDALQLPSDLPVRHLLPSAPFRPVTISDGQKLRAWYDIISFSAPSLRAVEADVRASAQQINALIDQLVGEGFASERIVLAGFSQGGVIASFCALRAERPLGGLLCLSTYLAAPEQLANEISPAARELPVCYMHGVYDDVVAMSLGWQAKSLLETLGLAPAWHEYPMRHEVCQAQLADMRHWLLARLG